MVFLNFAEEGECDWINDDIVVEIDGDQDLVPTSKMYQNNRIIFANIHDLISAHKEIA
jgi:hypothetical protein